MESRVVATERLRREGRWEEASAYKEAVRDDLRSQGTRRNEAISMAWEAMLQKYAPAETEEPEEFDFDALGGQVGDGEPDLTDDTLWVYQHLENKKAKPEDAPSLGAWSLLQWARRARNQFFERILPKAMTVRDRRGGGTIEDVDPSLDEVYEILTTLMRPFEENLLRGVPVAVQVEIDRILGLWTRHFNQKLPANAGEGLAASVTDLVSKVIKAVLADPAQFKVGEGEREHTSDGSTAA